MGLILVMCVCEQACSMEVNGEKGVGWFCYLLHDGKIAVNDDDDVGSFRVKQARMSSGYSPHLFHKPITWLLNRGD